MKPVHFRKVPKLPSSRILVVFFLVIVLVACGTNAAIPSSPAQPHPRSTAHEATKTPIPLSSNADTALNLNAANITEDVGSLHMQSALGFQCPGTGAQSESVAAGQLVLASSRTIYRQDEIAQMRAYLGAPDNATNPVNAVGAKPPSTLRWVLGGSVDTIPGTYNPGAWDPGSSSSAYENYSPCGATLDLTNTGNTPIQIPKVGVQLEGPPQQNTYKYRLIDACSVIGGNCAPSLGGNGSCGEYYAVIQLGLGEKNSVFSGVPSVPLGSCGILTIAPTAEIILHFQFSIAVNTPKNLIFKIIPILTLNTAQGEQIHTLSQSVSTFAFASVDQFSCYQLQGTSFIQEKSPIFSYDNWCM